MLPVLHDYIRDLTDMENLGIYLYARDAFPDKKIIMNRTYHPKEFKDAIEAKMAEGKNFMIQQAKNGPLQMLMMMPDPHGHGGSR